MSTGTEWRTLARQRAHEDRAVQWRHQRAVARVRKVDDLVADYATAYWGRPYRRREIRPFESSIELAGVIWSIDGQALVELHTLTEDGVARLLVHDIGLLAPLKRALRTRHIRIERPIGPP